MPNIVDDGHNNSTDHAAQCLQHQLFLLFSNEHFNDETPIVFSFDKNKSYAENSCILALLLGGARDIPMTRHSTRITPSSPSLSQTGALVALS